MNNISKEELAKVSMNEGKPASKNDPNKEKSVSPTPSALRKNKRLDILKKISKWLIVALSILGLLGIVLIYLNTTIFQKDIRTEIYFFSIIITGLISILSLCVGIIGGSSIN